MSPRLNTERILFLAFMRRWLVFRVGIVWVSVRHTGAYVG